MENKTAEGAKRPVLKLNYRRTMIIGFAFFGISLLWQTYDSWCSGMLSDLFAKVFTNTAIENQYLVGVIMALDNLAALIMLPIFGHLSDKTHSKIGKRMPYIVVGTFVSAVMFPFIPVFYYFSNLAGLISSMAVVIFFMMMYRNPAVALMPDLTPKPLRSKANGVINIMGYLGGGVASILASIFSLSQFIGTKQSWQTGNIWAIEIPFLVASVMMVISCVFLFVKIKENDLEIQLRPELDEGEKEAAVADSVANDEEKPMSKANKTMLILILVAEFFWFMAENGVGTYQTNYIMYGLGDDSYKSGIITIIGGVASVVGFLLAGKIVDKIGRKWTISGGLIISLCGYIAFSFVQLASSSIIIPLMAVIWVIKGFGMSLVHVNSFPMVVELCSSKKIGKFTGYYYAASMAAQTITPILLGLLLTKTGQWKILPYYALACIGISLIIFLFVKNIKTKKIETKKGLEALGGDD
jgi:maltose/moltooligosaccharide transporter